MSSAVLVKSIFWEVIVTFDPQILVNLWVQLHVWAKETFRRMGWMDRCLQSRLMQRRNKHELLTSGGFKLTPSSTKTSATFLQHSVLWVLLESGWTGTFAHSLHLITIRVEAMSTGQSQHSRVGLGGILLGRKIRCSMICAPEGQGKGARSTCYHLSDVCNEDTNSCCIISRW